MALVGLLVSAALWASCEVYSAGEQLCDYEVRATGAFSDLDELPVIGPGSSSADVAVFGRKGANDLESVIAEWHDLKPPSKAEVWRASMEDWLTTTYGALAMLGESDELSQAEVDATVDSWVTLRTGLMIELDQLNRQYAELFADC